MRAGSQYPGLDCVPEAVVSGDALYFNKVAALAFYVELEEALVLFCGDLPEEVERQVPGKGYLSLYICGSTGAYLAALKREAFTAIGLGVLIYPLRVAAGCILSRHRQFSRKAVIRLE